MRCNLVALNKMTEVKYNDHRFQFSMINLNIELNKVLSNYGTLLDIISVH